MVRKINYIILLLVSITSMNVYAKSTAALQPVDGAVENGLGLIVLGLTIIVTSIRMKISNVD